MWEHKEPGTMKILATLFQTFIFLKKKKIINTDDELFYVKKQNLVGHMMSCLVHVYKKFENFIELIKYQPSTVVETKNV